jgi:hypothetical protein
MFSTLRCILDFGFLFLHHDAIALASSEYMPQYPDFAVTLQTNLWTAVADDDDLSSHHLETLEELV